MRSAKPTDRQSGAVTGNDRHPGFRAVGVSVTKIAAPIAVKRGGGVLVRLKTDWLAIVGPEWGSAAWPLTLGRDGVLKLCVRPLAALELQHRAPLLIGRINLYFGRAAVTRMVLVQATPALASEPAGSALRLAVAANNPAGDPRLSGIVDPTLRAALERLAKAVAAAEA